MAAFVTGLADLVAAVWIWALLTVAFAVYSVGLYGWGWRRGRQARGRAEVLAAIELAMSETVAIPRPRQGVEW